MMRRRNGVGVVAIGLGMVVAACGGGGSGAPATTTAPATTEPAVTTAPAVETTAPEPTTSPATLSLADLPGTIAMITATCGPELPPETGDDGRQPVVCTVAPDGSAAKEVSLPGADPDELVFNRDGATLQYFDPYAGVVVVDLASGRQTVLKPFEAQPFGVSPDGTEYAFHDLEGIFIANSDNTPQPDGSDMPLVVADEFADYEVLPSWSPDGARFAYLSRSDGAGGELECNEVWIGSADGAAPVRITDNVAPGAGDGPAACAISVRWSPDGSRLLAVFAGKPEGQWSNAYVMNPDGSDLTALTEGEPGQSDRFPFNLAGSSFVGDWSPDGAQIALIIMDGQSPALYIVNADGSQLTRVADTPAGLTAQVYALVWSAG